jgi:sec-independent protein translocase protein TatB
MFGIGFTEFAIILVIALIAIGPEKLPEIMKVLGKAFGEFKKATQELKKTVDETTKDVEEEFAVEEVLKLEEEERPGMLRQSPPAKRVKDGRRGEGQRRSQDAAHGAPEGVQGQARHMRHSHRHSLRGDLYLLRSSLQHPEGTAHAGAPRGL